MIETRASEDSEDRTEDRQSEQLLACIGFAFGIGIDSAETSGSNTGRPAVEPRNANEFDRMPAASTTPTADPLHNEAYQAASRLTTEQLAGECIMPRLQMERYLAEAGYRSNVQRAVREHAVNGYCVFGGAVEEVVRTLEELQQLAETSHGTMLLFSADCEFGLPMRFSGSGTEFPDAMAIAHTGDPSLSYQTGRGIAREMRSVGLHWNFAPVADVNSNPANPIINTRSFGETPMTVTRFSVAYTHGLQDAGIVATAKHFPGHGDTAQDSHRELPFVEGGWERFESLEIIPFRDQIAAGVLSIMPGHLAAPDLAKHLGGQEADLPLPATLSPILTRKLLRDHLGFQGVIVTDALEMQAITNGYGATDASLRAFHAGADVLLLPVDPEGAYQALLQATREGSISESELRERASRIEMLRRFVTRPVLPKPEGLDSLLAEDRSLAERSAVEALETRGTLDAKARRLLVLVDDRPQAKAKAEFFASRVKDRFDSIELISMADWNTDRVANVHGNCVIATFHRARGYIGGPASDATMPGALSRIASSINCEGGSLSGLLLFGSPYLDSYFHPQPRFVLKTYSESAASVEAALKQILAA